LITRPVAAAKNGENSRQHAKVLQEIQAPVRSSLRFSQSQLSHLTVVSSALVSETTLDAYTARVSSKRPEGFGAGMNESSAAKESLVPVRTLIAERYRVLRVLGEGSSGIVYLCEHTALEKEVAVKVLHRELADNASLVARFTREAQTAARLDHPNSVHVMDFGQDRDGTLYLAMEYVEGADLAELLQQKLPLTDERIVHYMSCILSALSAAHALGIVHRDLKPENVLVRVDETSVELDVVKVCDFGVAQFSPVRLARNSSSGPTSTQTRRVTGDGMMVGTPWYMSPEQARAETLDARSDIYSAGVVLFQLLTRTLPFMGDDVMAVALAHCTTPPPPPSGYCAVHPALEAVCLKALSKTPDLRFQSASEMLTAVREAVAVKAAPRSLARARVSRPSGTAITLAPITVRPERLATTPLATPSVRMPTTLRKVRPSLLIAGVATTLLGVAAVPRFLPSQHTVNALSAAASRSARKIEQAIGMRKAPQLSGMSIQNDPTLLQPLAAEIVNPADGLLTMGPEILAATDVPAPQPNQDASTMLAQPTAAAPSVNVAPAQPAAAKAAVAVPSKPQPLAAKAATTSPGAVVPVQASVPSTQPMVAKAAVADAPQPAAGSVKTAAVVALASADPKLVAPVVETATAVSGDEDVPESPGEAAASAAAIALSTLPAAQAPAPVPVPVAKKTAPIKLARVEISAERLPPGVPRGVLRGALNPVSLLACYTQAQQRLPQLELTGTALDLKTNTSGRQPAALALILMLILIARVSWLGALLFPSSRAHRLGRRLAACRWPVSAGR
jgi:serine/threonine protein kinase